MTLYQDIKPVYGPYGSWPSVCDRTALDEIDLYGDVLSFIAEIELTRDAGGSGSDGRESRLSWAEIDAALGVVRPA